MQHEENQGFNIKQEDQTINILHLLNEYADRNVYFKNQYLN